jgi:2-oxoglutarate ferredoxin oxidoreductase subunit alpha
MQARWGTHGDHPIIVLAPSSVEECFALTVKAFNFAEKYRTPVILLSDEVVGHMREVVPIPGAGALEVVERDKPPLTEDFYLPYSMAEDVPPLAAFGGGHNFHVTGLLHDESGFPTLVPEEMSSWYARVFRKIERSLDDIILYEEYDLEDAETLVISFGCSARSARGAQRRARREGRKVGFLKLLTLWPFPEEAVVRAAARVRKVVVPELNLGQLRSQVGCCLGKEVPVVGVNRMDGEVITPGQIMEAL